MIGGSAASFAGCTQDVRAEPAAPPATIGSACAGRPLRIAPRPRALLDVPPERWRRIESRFTGSLESTRDVGAHGKLFSTPSIALHALILRGTDAHFEGGLFADSAAILQALTDAAVAERVFGGQLLARTMHGVRYRPSAVFAEARTLADEHHVDQNLAGLAAAGLPLSHEVRGDGWQATVGDVLADAIANYDFDANESEWTTLALVLYGADLRQWTNKYGERFDFDAVARKLMERPRGRGSCAGLHVLQCLTFLARAHEQCQLLSADTSRQLLEVLRKRVDNAIGRQRPDGTWDRTWWVEPGESVRAWVRERDELLLVTGHLTECLLTMPSDIDVPDACLEAAGRWLLAQLEDIDPNHLRRQFCPYTHAAVSVRCLRS